MALYPWVDGTEMFGGGASASQHAYANSYDVYIFYFPGPKKIDWLMNELKSWGNSAGDNLFIGACGNNDPEYSDMVKRFNLVDLPALVVTADPKYASSVENEDWHYVSLKLDDKKLLENPKRTMECLQRSYNYYLQERVGEALKHAKKDASYARLESYFRMLRDGLQPIGRFLDNHRVKFLVSPNNVGVEVEPIVQDAIANVNKS